MTFEIKEYSKDYIKKQVDLIWKVTDPWKYGYQTSYDSLTQSY